MRKLLKKALGPENIFIGLSSTTKPGIIQEMLAGLAEAGKIHDLEAAERAVMEREHKMSTGMKHGVAIPHGKTDSVDKLVAAVGIRREGVEFECSDGKPARIFIMTVSPANRSGPHIQFLAEISKILRRKDLRERLLEAGTADEVIAVFMDEQ